MKIDKNKLLAILLFVIIVLTILIISSLRKLYEEKDKNVFLREEIQLAKLEGSSYKELFDQAGLEKIELEMRLQKMDSLFVVISKLDKKVSYLAFENKKLRQTLTDISMYEYIY